MKTVLLVDLSSIFHPAWKATDGNGRETFRATLNGVDRCIARASKGGAEVVTAVCMDSRTSWRKNVAPSYKANREALPQTFYSTLEAVRAALDSRLTVWRADGFEADDILATAGAAAIAAGHGDVVIATGDKDMFQLLAHTQVRMLKTTDYTFCTAENVIERFGVAPDKFGDFLAICGDTADGVKGARGVGPAHAAEALGKWSNLTSLYAALESDPAACGVTADGNPYAWAQSLVEHYADVMLARKLVELRRDVPIDFNQIYETKETPMTAEEKTNPPEQSPEPVRNDTDVINEFDSDSGSMEEEWFRPTCDPMTTSPRIDRISAALARAQGMIKGAKKDSDNPFFKSRYADLASVWDACRSALTSVGIGVVQIPNGTGNRVPLKCFDKNDAPLPDGEGAEQRLTTLLVHPSGQWIGGTFTMTAGDVTPQACGSCITYMRRYSLAALVGVAPEDDDGNAASRPTNASLKR